MLKLYRVSNENADYDELEQAIVWARSPVEALAIVNDALDAPAPRGLPGGWGSRAERGEYVATEVTRERGPVLGFTAFG